MNAHLQPTGSAYFIAKETALPENRQRLSWLPDLDSNQEPSG